MRLHVQCNHALVTQREVSVSAVEASSVLDISVEVRHHAGRVQECRQLSGGLSHVAAESFPLCAICGACAALVGELNPVQINLERDVLSAELDENTRLAPGESRCKFAVGFLVILFLQTGTTALYYYTCSGTERGI